MKIRRVLMLMLWVPALAFAQQPYYGTMAYRISLSEGADPADLNRIPIRSGDVITPENVRASIQALFDTNRYRSVEVEAVASGNGTDLTFKLGRHYFFSTFTLQPENLLGRPLSTLLRLPVGQKYSDSQVQEIVDTTKQLLQDSGYFNAPLTVQSEKDDTHHLESVRLYADTDVKRRARISAIDITGAGTTFTASELRKALHVSPGDPYSVSEIDKGVAEIKQKFLEKNFLNTRIDVMPDYIDATNSVRITLNIQPGQETLIDTGHQIPDDEVRNLVPIFEEGDIDPDLIREGKGRIIEYLQQKGYFEATVEGPEVVPASFGNPTRIVFTVRAGEKHRVQSVEFKGNDFFKTEAIQKNTKIRPAGLFTRGLYSDSLAKADVTSIQNMYRRAGFEAVIVEIQHEDSIKHEIDVVFDITENTRYPIEQLVFTGNATMPETDLRKAIGIKEGDCFSPEEAENARTALTRYYFKMGYPDVLVDATADTNPDTHGKVLTYHISEGRRYHVGQLLVAGNTRTIDPFVKRTSGLKEYEDWYNPENVLEAQRRLYATGLFTHVDVVPLDQDTGELRTMLIQIEEAKPILVTPGIGVKEYAGPRLTLDVTHNNLWGRNRAIAVRIRAGVYEQQFQTTYHEPRLFNHDKLDGFGTLTIENRNRPSYKTSGTELALQVRKLLSSTRSVLGTASYQNVDLKDVKLNPIVRLFPDVEGIIQIARLGVSFLNDNRDDALDPKRGMLTTSTFQVANKAFGSEVDFLSLFNQTTYQTKKGVGIVAVSSRIGWKVPYGDTPELPITERYFAGGSTTLRGFGVDEAGPPGGGQLLTIGNVEYRVPLKSLWLGELGGAVFYDTGNVYERPSDFSLSDFTHSAGLGLRFLTPLGPVRFDTGFNLNPKIRIDQTGLPVREERVHFFFTLGHPF